MKKFIKCAEVGFLLLIAATLNAQTIIHVASGGQMFIAPQAGVSFSGLVMVPSQGGFLLGENNINKRTDPVSPFAGVFLRQVYSFSNPVLNYNGSLGIFYNENKPAGVNEKQSLLQYCFGNAWQSLTDSKNNNLPHGVIGISNVNHLSFGELLSGYGRDPLHYKQVGNEKAYIAPGINIALSIALYPNPAKDIVNVQVNSHAPVISVQLYDASGRLLMIKAGSPGNLYVFTINTLASGIYNILVETKDGRQVKQFIKQ